MPIPVHIREQIIEIWEKEGLTITQISKRFRVSASSVSNFLRKARDGESLKPRQGVHQKTSLETRRKIAAYWKRCKNKPSITALAEKFGVSSKVARNIVDRVRLGKPLCHSSSRIPKPRVKEPQRTPEETKANYDALQAVVLRKASALKWLYGK